MDKTKRGIALFITLLVIASILSIVAVSFSYLGTSPGAKSRFVMPLKQKKKKIAKKNKSVKNNMSSKEIAFNKAYRNFTPRPRKPLYEKIIKRNKFQNNHIANSKPTKSKTTAKTIKKYYLFTEKIFFSKGSVTVEKAYVNTLKRIAAKIKNMKNIRYVIVEGHTSMTGNYDYNIALSIKRAKNVKRFLIKQGIKSQLLKIKGFGPTRPIIKGTSEEANSINRRVEIRLIY